MPALLAFLFAVAVVRAAGLPDGWTTGWPETGRPALVVFSAAWCGPCQFMVREVFPEPGVRAALKDRTAAYIDGDLHPSLIREHSVSAYPTLVCLDADGNEIGRRVGAFPDGEALIAFLRDPSAGPQPGGSTASLQQRLKLSDAIRADPDSAGPRIERILLILRTPLDSLTATDLDQLAEDVGILRKIAPETPQASALHVRLPELLRTRATDPLAFRRSARTAVERHPDDPLAPTLLETVALDCMDAGEYADAAAAMARHLDAYPEVPHHEILAHLHLQIRRHLDARAGRKP